MARSIIIKGSTQNHKIRSISKKEFRNRMIYLIEERKRLVIKLENNFNPDIIDQLRQNSSHIELLNAQKASKRPSVIVY